MAGEQAQRVAYQAREQGEHLKANVAGGLHTAANRLRQQGAQVGRPSMISRAADPLDRSARYLESHSIDQIGGDVQKTARERPLVAAVTVFAAAFLVGRLLRRR
jgi:hypothetical protein